MKDKRENQTVSFKKGVNRRTSDLEHDEEEVSHTKHEVKFILVITYFIAHNKFLVCW